MMRKFQHEYYRSPASSAPADASAAPTLQEEEEQKEQEYENREEQEGHGYVWPSFDIYAGALQVFQVGPG